MLFFLLECVDDTEGLQCVGQMIFPAFGGVATAKLYLQPVRQDPGGATQTVSDSFGAFSELKQRNSAWLSMDKGSAAADLSAKLVTLSWSLGNRRTAFQKILSGALGVCLVTSAGRLSGAHTLSLGS